MHYAVSTEPPDGLRAHTTDSSATLNRQAYQRPVLPIVLYRYPKIVAPKILRYSKVKIIYVMHYYNDAPLNNALKKNNTQL